MPEGKQLVIEGELDEKRDFAVDDGRMYCLTIVGRGFTHDQYVPEDVYHNAPQEGEPILLFGDAKVNKNREVTIKMNSVVLGKPRKAA